MSNQFSGTEIAIIGMAGRYPKSANLAEFWRHLCDGDELISFFNDEELAALGVDPALLRDPSFVKAAGVLEDMELFDAGFFGVLPREAELMDPQQRLFLECAWEALEYAGYDSQRYGGLIGMYAGAVENTYLLFNLMPNPELRRLGMLPIMFANGRDYMPTRVSYKLNLRGPSYLVQSACSTSLVAIHTACQSLINRECDMALAGGVSVLVNQRAGYTYIEGGIVSPDGRCRSFDADAQGTIFGSGVGIVVLKPLENAIADGDTIHAIIRGSAVNNDGALKVSYTAPSVSGQAEVIIEALAAADVEAETIGYVEAHGTATAIGDTIEIQALTQAFRTTTDRRGFCAIGSVKSNLGHLDAAAGVTGVLKTVLSLQHQQIPPTLHFRAPNPQIDFASTPFYINARLADWSAGPVARRAGVSSFGIGGTNAHVILEEAPSLERTDPPRPWQVLLLSARTAAALDVATDNLIAHLRQQADLNLADVAYTLQVGRSAFDHRRMVVCCDCDDAVSVLEQFRGVGKETTVATRVATKVQVHQTRSVAFLFPGQGAQHVGMSRELYTHEPVFRECVDRCCELLAPHLGIDIRDVIWEDGGVRESVALPHAPSLLDQTQYAQPALFTIEYALAQLWMHWGVRPKMMIGHSIGEYVAACVAGVFSLEDALALVAARGRLMQQLHGGAMLDVALPEPEVRVLLNAELALAAVNAPGRCVVAGPIGAVERLERQLVARGITCRALRTSHAFHSAMMDPIIEPFAEVVQRVRLRPPQIPYLSNITGARITAAEATAPRYWVRHLRETVRFAEGLQMLAAEVDGPLLEVGPGQALSRFAQLLFGPGSSQLALASLPHSHDGESDLAFILGTAGRLWLHGVAIDWTSMHAEERRRRIPLPTYPFDRKRYWIEPRLAVDQSATLADAVASDGQLVDEAAPMEMSDATYGANGRIRVAEAELTAERSAPAAETDPAIVERCSSVASKSVAPSAAVVQEPPSKSRRRQAAMEEIVARQLQIMAQQLSVLRDRRSGSKRENECQ